MDQVRPYDSLLATMNKYDGDGGRRTPRERAITAISHENTLFRHCKAAGGAILNAAPAVGGGQGQNIRQTGVGNQVGDNFNVNVNNNNTNGPQGRQNDQDGQDNQRASFMAIAGIATLVFGTVAAAGYSVSRLMEVSSTKKDIEDIKTEAQQLPDYLHSPAAKISGDNLVKELNEAHYALTKDLQYYRATTFATVAFMLGTGFLAYDRLFHRSLRAYQAMIASYLTSAASFGVAVGFCGVSSKEREDILETLYRSYEERRVAEDKTTGQTLYEFVESINNVPTEPDKMPPPYAPSEQEPQQATESNYAELWKEEMPEYNTMPDTYTRFEPFPQSAG